MLPANHQQKPGFTLLETILALTLSVIVLGIIGIALDMHLTKTEQSRVDVERAQLVRALMRQISDDLRNTVRNSTLDVQSAEDLAANAAGIDPDALEGELPADLTGEGTTEGDGTDETQEPVDLASSNSASSQPGLYGNETQLQIDILQLPRADELIAAANSGKLVSDVRTVAYFIGTSTAKQSVLDTEGPLIDTGLIRRSLSRSATLFADQNGSEADLNESAELLAPEVVGLEFRYWDGKQWATTWSSEEQLGLPLAVEIVLTIDHSITNATKSSSSSLSNIFSSDNEDTDTHIKTYRSVVRIHAARHIEVEESEQPEEETGEGL